MRLYISLLGFSLMLMSCNAQTWMTGDNSTITGCSTHCALNDDDLSCWNSTANFFTKMLIGQLRHYIAVQVDIDQWHRRHGKPDGQDMDIVGASIEQSFLSELHPKDILTNTTVIKVAKVLSDRIRDVSDHVITWVPHFQCPVPCEYRYNNYKNLFIASMVLNVCLVLAVIPFMIRLIRHENEWGSESRLIST
uniref:GP2 n=1 Tax=Haemonchus contortus TaxID=6289 RepID=A0A7I4YB46_HAECO